LNAHALDRPRAIALGAFCFCLHSLTACAEGQQSDSSGMQAAGRDSGGTDAGGTGAEAGMSSGGSTNQAGKSNTGGSGGKGDNVAGESGSSGSGGGGGDAGGTGGGGTGGGGTGGMAGADQCPQDPQKTAPGECGCGVPETCTGLVDALKHRYSFSTNNMMAMDSVGDAHATLIGVSAAGGKVTFNGTDVAYVDLPNGTISALTDATFELWFAWTGGPVWQRLFDFGSNTNGEGNQGEGLTYLFLTASDGDSGNALRASFTLGGTAGETVARSNAALPTGNVQHIVLVVDDTGNQMRLYLNHELRASTTFNGTLGDLDDVNNWIGRSNWNDPPLRGELLEFRIYDAALSESQIALSESVGPDPAFLD
jgi:hypothetical protein